MTLNDDRILIFTKISLFFSPFLSCYWLLYHRHVSWCFLSL